LFDQKLVPKSRLIAQYTLNKKDVLQNPVENFKMYQKSKKRIKKLQNLFKDSSPG
jgi:hypothetical protein